MADYSFLPSAARTPRRADTRYAYTPWTDGPDYSYLGPFSSNEERLTTQALSAATIPGHELQDTVRPPLPQINPFPARFGYERRSLGVRDILTAGRNYATRISWFSGGVGQYSGSSRDTLGNGV